MVMFKLTTMKYLVRTKDMVGTYLTVQEVQLIHRKFTTTLCMLETLLPIVILTAVILQMFRTTILLTTRLTSLRTGLHQERPMYIRWNR